jgi:hypothetical protein
MIVFAKSASLRKNGRQQWRPFCFRSCPPKTVAAAASHPRRLFAGAPISRAAAGTICAISRLLHQKAAILRPAIVSCRRKTASRGQFNARIHFHDRKESDRLRPHDDGLAVSQCRVPRCGLRRRACGPLPAGAPCGRDGRVDNLQFMKKPALEPLSLKSATIRMNQKSPAPAPGFFIACSIF